VGFEAWGSVVRALGGMARNGFWQIPVTRDKGVVGSLSEPHAYACIVKDPKVRSAPVCAIMQKAFRFVDIETPVSLLAPMITPENPAVLVRDFPAGKTYILTGSDGLGALAG